MNPECEGFTLSKEFKCILHKTAKTFHFTQRRISQVGIRNRTSTFPKYCEEEQRLERCKNEPKCQKILNCFRKGCFILYRHTYRSVRTRTLHKKTEILTKNMLFLLNAFWNFYKFRSGLTCIRIDKISLHHNL